MGRLHELAKRQNADLKDVIAVEHEMTRVRGELEKLRSEQRLLGDSRARDAHHQHPDEHGVHAEPELKFELVPHVTQLHLVDAGGRAANRTGGGVSVMFSRWFSLDFEMFPREGGQCAVVPGDHDHGDLFGFPGRRPAAFLQSLPRATRGRRASQRLAGVRVRRRRRHRDRPLQAFPGGDSGRALGLWYRRDAAPTSDIVLEGVLGVGVPF